MSEFDPDDTPNSNNESEEFEQFINALDDCDLGTWDRDFVDDLLIRIKKRGSLAVVRALTARQKEQLDRMKEQYNVEEETENFLL